MKKQCLQQVAKVLGRELTKEEEATLDRHFNTATREFVAQDRAGFSAMSPEQRMVEITRRAKEMALQSTAERAGALVHQAMIETGNLKMLERVADKKQAVTFVRHMISQDAGNISGNTSAETLAKAVHMNAMRRLQELAGMDDGKFFGLLSNPERRALALKAVSGETTGDPAADRVAKAVADVNKELMAQAKSAGVSIHDNPLWHRPQVDSVDRIRAVSQDDWVKEVAPLVDRQVMLDGTGRPNTPEALEKYLREIYETKAMDGVNKLAAGGKKQGPGFGRVGALNKERQLYFKDTDSYVKYMDKYADYQTAYQMFDAHYRRFAIDIALAQKFGPEAYSHINDLSNKARDMALKANEGDVSAMKKTDKEADRAQREVKFFTSPNAVSDSRVSMFIGMLRDLESSVMLGNGILSAVPDASTLKLMAEQTEIPQARLYKSFIKASATKQEDLALHGIFLGAALKQINRFGSENFGGGTKIGRWVNNAVHHAAGLHLWDKMGRAAWSEGVLWKIGQMTRTMESVDEFNKNMMFAKQGVDQQTFDIWRAADLGESPINKSDKMLTPDSIYNIPDEKLRPIIEQRLAERSQVYKDAIQKREDSIATLKNWGEARLQKHEELTAKLDESLDNYIGKRDMATGEQVIRSKALMDYADKMKEAAAAAKAAFRASNRRVYSDMVDAVVRAEKAQAAVRVAEVRLNKDLAVRSKEIDAKQNEVIKRITDSGKALQKVNDTILARVQKHEVYMKAYQNEIGNTVEREMQVARSDAAVKLLSTVYDTEQSAFRGAMGLTNQQQVKLGYDKYTADSAVGQLARCFLQFKSVPLGIFWTHFIEMPKGMGAGKGPLGMSSANWYRAKMLAYTTLLGGLSSQLISIARGEQPKSVVDPQFWMEAFARGGGLGLYADTLKASFDAKGAQDVLSQFAGPVINAGIRLTHEGIQAGKDAAEGKGKSSDVYAQHGIKWLRQNAAVGMNVFWAKAAFNRMIYDQAQDYFVPGTSQRQADQAKKQRGTDYWWTPGHQTPDKELDMSRVFKKPEK